jgi:invasion protein IalB
MKVATLLPFRIAHSLANYCHRQNRRTDTGSQGHPDEPAAAFRVLFGSLLRQLGPSSKAQAGRLMKLHGGIVPRALVATLALLIMTACGGGWSGSGQAPTITGPANETVSVGQTASFTVTATGTGPFTYQWSKNGTAIPGATSSTYTTPATVIGDSGSLFTVTVSNASGMVTGGPATLTVNPTTGGATVNPDAPLIITQPLSQTVTAGQTATFTVSATGTGPLTYQWFDNGVAIGGATSSSYTTPATVSSESGSVFTVTVTNSLGGATSGPATLTVITANTAPPLIVTQPANQTVNAGQTATFTVTATGTGPLTYQWSKNGTAISGATSSTYTTPATVSGDSGSLFTVTVSNGSGTVTSGPATLTVNTAPLIVTQPANQTVNAGQTATFTVTATGTGPLTYQWSKNGTAISGATSSTYTTPATVSGDSGSLFTVTVTNGSGTATGGPATLTVNTAPIIVTQPASQTITVGQTATFTVVATGTAPLTYQWFKGGVLITGATSSTYITPVTTVAGVSQYTVVVTNTVGSATSNPAMLTVINTVPLASLLSCNPSTPPYNSSVTLVPTFSGGTGVIGSTGAGSVDITAAAISGGSYPTSLLIAPKTFTLTVTGTGGATASTTCTATPTAVTISNITPANPTIAPGKETFNATASGGATNALTWSASAGSFAGNVWTSPNTAGTYTITATSVDEPSVFVTTTVTVSAPVITTQPASQNICTNGSLTLSVAANFASTYQWNLNGTAIQGATSSSYFIASAIAVDAGNYTVTVTNAAGSVTSNVAKVTVGSVTVTNPATLTVLTSQTATFSVTATGDAPFTYQWFVITPGSSTGTEISGATQSTYTTPAVTANSNNSRFFVVVTDACSTATSASATLLVNTGDAPPTILTQPVSQTVAIGGTATFTVTASGSPTLTYQWYRIPAGGVNGVAISGATSTSYTVPDTSTTINNDGDEYYVIVTNSFGQATSQNATLAVGSGILITKQPADAFVDAGASATFSVTAVSALPLTYQWFEAPPGSKIFTAIAGATSASYTQASTATTDSGSVFKVVVSNGVTASVTSNSASLFVGALSDVGNLCSGWTEIGSPTPPPPTAECSIQLVPASTFTSGEIVWPHLISTGNIQLSFTITTDDPNSPLPADGFALVLGDPSLGATPTMTGANGMGLGAEGIPGFVLAFDDFYNAPNAQIGFPGDPSTPTNPDYLGVGRGETALWENPYTNVNNALPGLGKAIAAEGETISHNYVVSIVQGMMTVTMDGTQVFSGTVSVPPVAYLYFTSATGGSWEQTVISNLTGTISAPSN